MYDLQIRELLQRTELKQYINDRHSKVVAELKLPVLNARIDIAVINGHLHGYEIKSAQDTLQRLPAQLVAYSKVFDYLTIVTELKYHDKILNIIPKWVGVSVCSKHCGNDKFEVIQPAIFNDSKESFYIAKLLWHDELIEILTEHDILHKKTDRNWTLCETMATNLEINILSSIVREKLKQRNNWKFKEGNELK